MISGPRPSYPAQICIYTSSASRNALSCNRYSCTTAYCYPLPYALHALHALTLSHSHALPSSITTSNPGYSQRLFSFIANDWPACSNTKLSMICLRSTLCYHRLPPAQLPNISPSSSSSDLSILASTVYRNCMSSIGCPRNCRYPLPAYITLAMLPSCLYTALLYIIHYTIVLAGICDLSASHCRYSSSMPSSISIISLPRSSGKPSKKCSSIMICMHYRMPASCPVKSFMPLYPLPILLIPSMAVKYSSGFIYS